MIYNLLFLLLFNFICSIAPIRLNRKITYIISIILIALIFGGSTGGPDYNNYYTMYMGRRTSYNQMEFAFYWSIDFFRAIGVSYNVYYLVLVTISVSLLAYSAYLFVGYSQMFLFLYLLWPAIIDSVQIRNMVAMAFVTLGIALLVKNDKKGYLQFFFCLLVATGFQSMAVLYFPVFFLKKKYNFKTRKTMLALLAFLAISLSLPQSAIRSMSSLLQTIFKNDIRASLYLSRSVRIGFLMNWGMQGVNFLFALVMRNYYLRNVDSSNFRDDRIEDLIEVFYNVQIFMFIFFPLYRINTNFLRLIRNLFPLSYITLIGFNQLVGTTPKRIDKEVLGINVIYIVFLIAVIIVQIVMPHMQDVILPIINSRWL